jgi:hypothetical protein
MPHPIVDILVSIDVPLVRTYAFLDIQGERLKGACHMRNAAREQSLGVGMQPL